MWLRRTVAICLLMAAGLSAQSPSGEQRKLTVWRVVPIGPARPVSIASLSPEVHSQTSGSFGQTSGSFGNTAGNTGQTAGSLGQTAGSAGKTAGSTGQSAGNFGESLDTISAAAEASNGTLVSAPMGAAAATSVTGTVPTTTAAVRAKRDPAWERFSSESKSRFEVTFEDVGASELRTRLDAVAGKEEAPDVLVTLGRPAGLWRNTGLTGRDALRTVGKVEPIPQTETQEIGTDRVVIPEISVMVHAPHPHAARAFALWLLDERRDWGTGVAVPDDARVPVAMAKGALESVLSGGGVGGASDPEMARFDSLVAQRMALLPGSSDALGALKIEIETTAVTANERLAVVSLRAVMEGPNNFGSAHAVVVLRADEAGQWKVLQLTPNLPVDQQDEAIRELRSFAIRVRPDAVEKLTSVALAAPVDGDNRSPVPEFWWENPGGGTLQIVEWQKSDGNNFTSSNMYFVPGDNGHLRTRATGRFADTPGMYRWRVWSLGGGGTVALSRWRTVNIGAQ
jgi:hypothetical protein